MAVPVCVRMSPLPVPAFRVGFFCASGQSGLGRLGRPRAGICHGMRLRGQPRFAIGSMSGDLPTARATRTADGFAASAVLGLAAAQCGDSDTAPLPGKGMTLFCHP